MIILKEKLKKISEAQEVSVSFKDFVQAITSKQFIPNHLEVFNSGLTQRFHVALAGNFKVDAKTTFVDFVSNGSALTVISVGQNDYKDLRMATYQNGKNSYRFLLRDNLTLFVSQV
jgi:hypothetical protein